MITAEWFLHAFGATFENITVTRSYNKITLQFTQTSGTAGDNALGLCQSAIKTPSYFKTLICKTSNYTNVSRVKTYIGGTSQQVLIVIPNCTTGNEHVSMAISKNEGSGSYFEAADVYCQVINTPVSIDISDCALYMGQFKNPPIVPSFDVNPLKQFMLTDLSNGIVIKRFYSGSLANNTRYRIINLGTVSNHLIYGNFYLTKDYNNMPNLLYEISFSVGYNTFNSSYTGRIKINGFSGAPNYSPTGSSGALRGAQIVADSTTGNVYICVTSGTSLSNNNWNLIFNKMFLRSSSGVLPQPLTEAMIVSPKTTDTVIVTSDAIDGF